MNDRQAIIEHHRAKRLDSTTGNAGTLADVERAALAFEKKVIDTHAKLKDEGRLSEAGIAEEMTSLFWEWRAQADSLEKIVADVEARETYHAQPGLPERTTEHESISAGFRQLSFEDRQVWITRARNPKTPDDQKIAEALATEPGPLSTLIPQDRAAIIDAVSPESKQATARKADIEKRIAGARATLAEITQKIGAVK